MLVCLDENSPTQNLWINQTEQVDDTGVLQVSLSQLTGQVSLWCVLKAASPN